MQGRGILSLNVGNSLLEWCQKAPRATAQPARPFHWRRAFWFSTECTSLGVIFNYVIYIHLIYAGSQSVTLKNCTAPWWVLISAFKCCFFTDVMNFMSKLDFLSACHYLLQSFPQILSSHHSYCHSIFCMGSSGQKKYLIVLFIKYLGPSKLSIYMLAA